MARLAGRFRIRLAVGGGFLALALVASGITAGSATAATDPCAPLVNPVVCENSKTGSPPAEWDIFEAGDDSIQGFATDISVNRGQTINFKIKTTASAYTIDIYRLGWYNGNGARKITSVTPSAHLPQSQPECITDPATEIYDCGVWAVSASWTVPANTVSGVFIAKLRRPDNGDTSHITFIVRDDSSTSALFLQTSDATWHAYNMYGGSNFYHGGNNGRAYKISYNRPFGTRGNNPEDFLFSNEYPMLRFLERNGYDVSYTTNVDSDRRGELIKNHQVFLSVGHDEYWSGQQRANVEAARDAGVNLAFFSGNESYWRTRWETSKDGSATAYRTLVCYKETWNNAKIDPAAEWTGTWRDPRFSPPSNGGRPENALTGTAYMSNSTDLAVQVPAEQGKYRLWRDTGLASLAAGQTATLAPHTVGYESNEDLDNGFRPAGLIRLSTTVGPTPEYLRDYGNTVTPGTTTHHLTLYRADSGALVFSAGTIQWAWGLDEQHDGTVEPADPRMQQATLNLLADMGAQPATRMSGLVTPTASTDSIAPTTTITSPASGSSVTNGSQVTVQGTAADTGGGRVAGVEVSTDGGTSWHPATGTTSWSYPFYTNGAGTQAVLVRAIDDSVNIGQPATLSLNLTGPSTIFGARVPPTPTVADGGGYELGVKFKPQTDGFLTGIRFYKGTTNTGTHVGSLWSSGGTRLARATFTGETGSGWQQVTFATPVAVTAFTTYVASYYAPNGHYAAEQSFFTAADFVSAPLTAPRSLGAGGNGVYREGAGFPSASYKDTNYYVDVLFTSSNAAGPVVVSALPLPDSTDVPVTTRPSVVFSKAVNPATIQFNLTASGGGSVPGSTSYDSATKTATFTPATALGSEQVYRASVQAGDTQGNAMESPRTWSFTTALDPSVAKLFGTDAVPGETSVNDTRSVELGVKFVASTSGSVVGVRFYQGPGNTGPHTGSLWSASGTLLARVTFPDNAGVGWQTARFATPVTVTAGTTYVASYFAPEGHYAADGNFFVAPYTNGPLTAPAGSNGVYQYAATTGFPTESYNSSNYWVEPLFVSDGGGPTPGPTGSPSPTPSASPTPSPTGTSPPPWPTDGSVTIFTPTDNPASANWNDKTAVEVGVRFRSDVDGVVTGVRFYKGPANTGVHTGSLWTTGGQLLGSGTFQNESGSGWQTVTFAQPIAISAGTTYVASYHTTVGYYAVTVGAFNNPLDRPPLHAAANGGVYRYGAGSAFPNQGTPHNYWVDVMFRTP
ncbi:DUF4082 domain-containing protein [Micromonospora chersina]|uniref:DUF4082 domain-containing protein n=1 Tax=Micromonospora chersina TaxID=47854 RepID=UPI003724C0CC